MELAQLPKVRAQRSAKRLGRGHSSGKGKTSGRGQKGQKARGKVRLGFEGGQTPIYKRLPFTRGKGMIKNSHKPIVVNLKVLALVKGDKKITLQSLIKAGIVKEDDARLYGVKILGDGEVAAPLIIALPISHKAQAKIEKAGGSVEAFEPLPKRSKANAEAKANV